jgi:hypothetical protein
MKDVIRKSVICKFDPPMCLAGPEILMWLTDLWIVDRIREDTRSFLTYILRSFSVVCPDACHVALIFTYCNANKCLWCAWSHLVCILFYQWSSYDDERGRLRILQMGLVTCPLCVGPRRSIRLVSPTLHLFILFFIFIWFRFVDLRWTSGV